MSSFMAGKAAVRDYIVSTMPKGSVCLDVGACDGVWYDLLKNHLAMDAIEIYEPNIITHDLKKKYVNVYNADIRGFNYRKYNLIIFGDVIEHMSVDDAQAVLAYAYNRADEIIVAVPFLYKQGAIYGNIYERHIQDDLTHGIFMKRYPGFVPLYLFDSYGYYRKRKPCDQ